MSDGELIRAFDDLYVGSSRRTLIPARLGAKAGGVTNVAVPGNPLELYISLGPNGEQGPNTAQDAVGVDTSVVWQQIWVRRELNKWVIHRASVTAGGGGAGSTTLDGLTDVDTSGAADGDLLAYDSTTGEWIPFTPTGTTGTAPSPHALYGPHHTSDPVDDSQIPQALLIDGTRALEGNLAVLPTITIDGVDISAHAGNTTIHHQPATAGNAGITVSGTQAISLNLEDSAPGLEIIATGVRVKKRASSGLHRDDEGIWLHRRGDVGDNSGLSMSETDGIWLSDNMAGNGLVWSAPSTRFLAVGAGEGILVNTNDVAVDQDFSPIWTGTHQFNQTPLINADLRFIGTAHAITSAATLTLAPTGNLHLDPSGNITMPNAQVYRSTTINDLPTGIDGVNIFNRTDFSANYVQMTIGAIKSDELHVRIFTADETRINRGEEYWSKSFGIVQEDFSVPAVGANVDVWFEDAPGMPGANLFAANDWLLMRTINWGTGLVVQKIWFQVVGGKLDQDTTAVDGIDRQRWRLVRRAGGWTTTTAANKVKAGNVMLDAGQVGQGWVHLSALASDGGPFIQFGKMTSVATVPDHSNYVRIGNLKNTVGYSVDTWGMAAGNNLGLDRNLGAFKGFVIEGEQGLSLWNTDLYIFNGATRVLGLTSANGLTLAHDVGDLTDTRRQIAWYDDINVVSGVPMSMIGSRVYDNGGVTTRQMEIFVTTASTAGASIVAIRALEPSASRDTDITLRSRDTLSTGAIGSTVEIFATEVQIQNRLLVGDELDETSNIAVLHVAESSTNVNHRAGFLIEQKTTGGVGDAVMHWRLTTPNRYYSMGIDNSDGDKFKISASASLGTSDFFVYDPATGLVTVSGLTGGSGGGGGTYTPAPGGGITITGTEIAVDGTVVRTDVDIIAGPGLIGGGALTGDINLSVNPGAGLELASALPGAAIRINLEANSGLNTTSGLQLDASVAGDGLEWSTGTSRIMQVALGLGLQFVGTTPARDVTIKLRSIGAVSSGLTVDTDGLWIRRRGDNGTDSGLSMNSSEGLYIADAVAGAGLEWSTTTERSLQLSLGGGLEFNDLVGAPTALVRIMLPANSGILRDATGIYLNPALAGNGLLMTDGEIDIVPSSTGGLSVTADSISIKRRTVSPGSGLNISADGLHIQRRDSSGDNSGISMTAADGIWLADNVAGDGLEWVASNTRFLRVAAGGGIVVGANHVAVDLDFNYPWTGNHTFDSASLFRVDSIAQFNNNINFMGARTILSTGNLTITPTGNLTTTPTGNLILSASGNASITPVGTLTLDPGGLILLPQAQTFQTVVASDNPTGIRGVTIFERSDIANYRQMNIGAFKADELYVRVFVADETRIDRGEEFWSKGFGIVHVASDESAPVLPAVGATFDVWFENAASFSGNIFGTNDWLLFRTIDFPGGGLLVQKIWCQATTFLTSEAATATQIGRQRWRLTRRNGGTTGQKILRGNVALNMGLSGQGAVHLSALVQDNGPFIQFGSWRGANPYTPFTGEDEPFTNYVRIGKLTGTVDYGSTVAWGLVTGNNVGATPEGGFSGLTADNLQGLRLFNTAINLYVGTNKVITLNQTQGLVLEFGATSTTPTARIDWVSDVDNRNAEIAAGHYAGIEVHSGPTFTTMGIVASDVTGTGALSLGAYSSDGTLSLTMSHNFIEFSGGGSYWRSRAGRFQIGGSDTLATASPLHVYESTTSATGVGAATGITIEQAGTGDALLHFLLTGGRRWMLGIDNSNSVDAFVITSTANLSTTPDLRLLPGGELQIEKLFTTSGMRIQPSAMIGDTTNYPDSVLHIYEATGAVGKTAGLTIDQAGSGDAVLQFRISVLGVPNTDIQRYVMGIDNSDNDKLKITYSVDLASNPIFVYDPATDGVGIGRSPVAGIKLHVNGSLMTPTIQGTTANNGNIVIEGTSSGVKTTSYVLLQPTGGLVGIGTSTPLTLLSASADGANATISAVSYGTGFAAQFLLYSANGTEATPQPTLSGDLIGQIIFQGRDTARSTGASIRAYASANWGTAGSGADDPTNLSFWTVPDGSQTQFERMTILSNGNIGIQNPAPAFVLDVNGTLNATGAATFGSSLAIGGALSGVTNLTIAGTLAGVTSLTMSGALTGATALTAATITANTSLISNTLAARTASGLSINDSSGNLAIFVESGGFVGINSADPINRFEVIETTLNAGVANFVINADDPVTIRGMTFRNSDQTANSVHGFRFDFTADNGGVTRGGAVAFGKEQLFTSVGTTRDAYFALLVAQDGTLVERLHITSGGRVGINTSNPVANEAFSRLTVSASDGSGSYVSIENTSTGQVGLVLNRTGGTVGRWVQYIAAGSNLLRFYNATVGDVMTLSATTGEVTLSANLLAPSLYGSNSANGNVTIQGTSHATKTTSYVLLQPTGGLVGVGVAAPGSWVDVAGDGATTPGVRISQYGVAAPHFVGRRSIGGKASPSAVGNGHVLMHLAGYGYTSGGWATNPSAEIKFVATENYLGTSYGGAEMQFFVHPNGTGALVQAMTIYNDSGIAMHSIWNRAYTSGNQPRPLFIDDIGYLTAPNIWITAITHAQSRLVVVDTNGIPGTQNLYAKSLSSTLIRPVLVDSDNSVGTPNLFDASKEIAAGTTTRPLLVTSGGEIGWQNLTRAGGGRFVVVTSEGYLFSQTSSLRYKQDIRTIEDDAYASLFAALRPVHYRVNPNEAFVDDEKRVYAGLLAEEVHDAGGQDFVHYDKEGRPDGLMYDQMIVMLIMQLRKTERRVLELEKRLTN
jgi:hypothetical protein